MDGLARCGALLWVPLTLVFAPFLTLGVLLRRWLGVGDGSASVPWRLVQGRGTDWEHCPSHAHRMLGLTGVGWVVCRVHAWTCLLASAGLSLVLVAVCVLGRPTCPVATCGHGPRTCYTVVERAVWSQILPVQGSVASNRCAIRAVGLVGDAGCSFFGAFYDRRSTFNWISGVPMPTRAGLTCPCVVAWLVGARVCGSRCGSTAVAAGCGVVTPACCAQVRTLGGWVCSVRARDLNLWCVLPGTRSALVGWHAAAAAAARCRWRRRSARGGGVTSAVAALAACQGRRRRRRRRRQWCFMDHGSLSKVCPPSF